MEIKSDVIREEDDAANDDGGRSNGLLPVFYPLFLPMDKEFESKYLFHAAKGKKSGPGWRDRVYLFLERPIGWSGVAYHISV